MNSKVSSKCFHTSTTLAHLMKSLTKKFFLFRWEIRKLKSTFEHVF